MRVRQLLFIVLLVTSPLVSPVLLLQGDSVQTVGTSFHLADDPIRIQNNAGLAALASFGAGTENDPFFIANLQLSMIEEEVMIDISNTDAHFVLFNCRIYLEKVYVAIIMTNVSNGVIEDCEISGAGIILNRCNRTDVLGCTISDSRFEMGIEVSYSEDISLVGNTVNDCSAGFFIIGSENVRVEANHIFDNDHAGIDIYLVGNVTVRDNVLENNGVILSLWGAGYNGHSIEGSQYIDVPYNIENNTVNGKPIGFFHEMIGSTIEGDTFGQVIFLNCSDVDIIGGTLTNTSIGFQAHFSRNCTIRDATISNNTNLGMYVYRSNFTSIEDCDIYQNVVGVLLEDSNQTRVVNNTISDNELVGVSVHYSNECMIQGNSISHNRDGISLSTSSDCLVISNEILRNTLFGISVTDGSHQNTIYGNAIGWNVLSNARDEAGSNFWDNGVDQGNSWSDYFGFGEYLIDYYGVDHFPSFLGNPLMSPVNLLLIGAGSAVVVAIIIGFVCLKSRRARGERDSIV